LPDESIVFEKTDEIAPFYKHDIDTLFFQPIVVSTPPIDGLWCDYQRWHSHQSLLDQPQDRSFVVGYYSCPNQAGNRLHDFMNSLIIAIATNRTLLWKYYDKETCAVSHMGYSMAVCNLTNHLSDCERILDRASWIPSYDEWAPKLDLPAQLGPRNPDFHIGSYKTYNWIPSAKTRRELNQAKRRLDEMTDFERHPSKETRFQQKVVQTSREWFLDEQVTEKRFRHELQISNDLTSPMARRLLQMFSEGVDFLYGMLFHDTFKLHPKLHAEETSLEFPEDVITIAMHVRHTKVENTGAVLSQEEQGCLEAVVNETRVGRPGATSCAIFLMSDRQESLNALTQLASAMNCSAVVTSHTKKGEIINLEHGPFAGLGFFQDLLVAGKARDGYVGHCGRSSSQMLQEIIQYGRVNGQSEGKISNNRPFTQCCLSTEKFKAGKKNINAPPP
jgi:hypothetical protein